MSQSRLSYDDQVYNENVKQSTGTLGYILNPIRYVNCRKCRIEQGITQGQDVSITPGNIVDMESDLSGRTRLNSKYDCNAYRPKCSKKGHKCKTDSGIPYDCDECQPDKLHLKSCSIVDYPTKRTSPGYTVIPQVCPPGSNAQPLPKPIQIPQGMVPGSKLYKPTAWQGNTGLVTWS